MTKSDFGTVISMMSLILGVVLPLISKNKSKKMKTALSIMAFAIVAATSIAFVNIYDFRDEDNELSEEELLQKAQDYYATEEYIEAAYKYENEKLDTNPIALNNLAYLYENGLGIAKDLDRATDLYHKAAQLGDAQAKENYISFVLRYPKTYSQVLNALRMGFDMRDKGIVEWLAQCGSGESFSKISQEQYVDYADIFLGREEDEQEKILKKYLYTETILAEYYVGVSNSEFTELAISENDPQEVFTGYYENREEDGKIISVPIKTYVKTWIIHEERFSIADDRETYFIKM